MSEVTQILDAIGRGDEQASEQLLRIINQDLRRLAASMLAQEPAGLTLEATALVHEAYIRLVDWEEEQKRKHRGHFFAAAAEVMRRINGVWLRVFEVPDPIISDRSKSHEREGDRDGVGPPISIAPAGLMPNLTPNTRR